MKKTINSNIAGTLFYIEEDAYEALNSYLQSVKRHFSTFPDHDEIMDDIESRISEQLQAATGGASSKIVTSAHVQEVIKSMGKVEEFGGLEKETSSSQEFRGPVRKRLFRNNDDVIIAGVCSGIAAYLGIDPVWVRLAFAISVFFGGFGVVLYVILWIVLPVAETETEKMEMRGEPVNIKNIENTIKERAEEFRNTDHSNLKKNFKAPAQALRNFFALIGKIVSAIVRGILKLVGILLVFAAAAGVVGLLITASALLINGSSQYIDVPLQAVTHGFL
ncbi:MAG TPA: PspC domain-containing protein, partial [Patescibacteria group bacterium]|nr:PspC domain-containing protein [Patescibacteria group bacterium]